MGTTLDYELVWKKYEASLEHLVIEIRESVKNEDSKALNRHLWCDKNNVPETMFVHAVNRPSNNLTYGVTPMCPFIEH